MSSSDRSNSRRISRSRSRISACTVTSSAVVGSSAIRATGSAAERQRDHRALPQAAAELMRILAGAPRRIGHAHGARAARSRGARGRAAARQAVHRSVSRSGSRSCRPDSSATIGSWNTKPIRRPRIRAHARPRRASSRFAAFELDAAAGDPARRHDEPDDRQRRDRLAAARFADQAERLAAPISNDTSSTAAASRPSGQREHRAQVLDAEQRRVRRRSSRCSPKTRRSASAISPSVARASTAAITGGTRFVPSRAARSTRVDRRAARRAASRLWRTAAHRRRLPPLALRIDAQQLDRGRLVGRDSD